MSELFASLPLTCYSSGVEHESGKQAKSTMPTWRVGSTQSVGSLLGVNRCVRQRDEFVDMPQGRIL